MTGYVEDRARERVLPETVTTLQRLVGAEASLLAELRGQAAHHLSDDAALADICAALNSDYVVHVARFFFLMKVLGCENTVALGTFIDGHNDKLKQCDRSAERAVRSPAEIAKARFSAQRREDVIETTRLCGGLALAKAEIADLLFDHGSRNRLIAALNVLVEAGVLTIVTDEAVLMKLPRPHRSVLRTDGRLEAIYERYLLRVGGSEP
ncbi:MAG: hypothetical protein AAF367_00605 [Pseudomonadota bacterium]